MRFFNTAGVVNCTCSDTMDVTMVIRLGCLRHRQYFSLLCITEFFDHKV